MKIGEAAKRTGRWIYDWSNWLLAAASIVLVAWLVKHQATGFEYDVGEYARRFGLGMAAWLPFFALFAMPLGEYVAHYVFMHRKQPGMGWAYETHHEGHHAKHINRSSYLDLYAYHHYAIASPGIAGFIIAAAVYGRPEAIAGLVSVFAVTLGHSAIWVGMHREIHATNCNRFTRWIASWPIYPKWKQHHDDHHRHPFYNYGVVYIWLDSLLGTKWQWQKNDEK